MQGEGSVLVQASVLAIGGRALMIEGPPGSGKSSLALSLIDRGAALIGDDGVELSVSDGAVIAQAPPNITGLIEVRGVGLVKLAISPPAPLALILTLSNAGERLPDPVPTRDVLGCTIPCLAFEPGSIAPAKRAEIALELHGLQHEQRRG